MSTSLPIKVPSGVQISLLFKQLIKRWHANEPVLDWAMTLDRFPQNLVSIEGKIARLGLVNCFQWHLEDECRAHYDSFESLARLKYAIDQSNQRRVEMIDEVDNQVVKDLLNLRPQPHTTRIALVTPGNLIDRLSILELKLFHVLDRKAHLGPTGANPVVELLEEQIKDVCTGMDELMEDLSAARLHLKFYRNVKLYGSSKAG